MKPSQSHLLISAALAGGIAAIMMAVGARPVSTPPPVGDRLEETVAQKGDRLAVSVPQQLPEEVKVVDPPPPRPEAPPLPPLKLAPWQPQRTAPVVYKDVCARTGGWKVVHGKRWRCAYR